MTLIASEQTRGRSRATATAFAALFSVVGLSLYGLPLYYDFMVRELGWSRRDQGRHAAELLLNGLDLEVDEPQRVIIPPRLIVRASSGAQR